ncbi:hypothetical protein [Nocardia pseudovaccinii]|uniref:hypothetical protein n=1 Tax=Nocardia pseudovaccinii TaxID=189540 RepID=UPI0007A540B4|nr:hypothetical protein [Nocardia pseudovaccinii]
MSEETAEAIARRAELRAVITEGLALIVEHADQIKAARAELVGEGKTFGFDPDFVYAPLFARAVDELVYAAHVAQHLNPDDDE